MPKKKNLIDPNNKGLAKAIKYRRLEVDYIEINDEGAIYRYRYCHEAPVRFFGWTESPEELHALLARKDLAVNCRIKIR